MLTMNMFHSVQERDISKNNNPGQSDSAGWSVILYTKDGGLGSCSGQLMFFPLSLKISTIKFKK